MTYDTGFAPNAFGKYLTLAACTPNHARSNVNIGGYIIGVEAVDLANKRKQIRYKTDIEQSLIYVAKISEILTLNEYFNDNRFTYKKIFHNKSWKEKFGDNVYFKENGMWKWLRGHQHDWERNKQEESQFFHIEEFKKVYENRGNNNYGALIQDIKGNRVFVSDEFMYFGDVCLPYLQKKEFINLLPKGQGTKCNHNENDLSKFINYIEVLKKEYGYGKHGNPINCRIDNDCTNNSSTIKKSCDTKK